MCRHVNMEYDASPGAAAVLLLRIVSKDAYVTPNLHKGYAQQQNRTYQVYFW